MNKNDYLFELEKALREAGVRDCEDIIEEYAEHFKMKTADGYGEEEIAARLAPPEEIAGQFREFGHQGVSKTGGMAVRIFTTIGVVFSDVIAAPILIVLYLWVITFGVFALVCAITGVTLAAGLTQLSVGSSYINIPPMPYICSLFIGITIFALAVISAVGTENCRLYVTQLLKKFVRWNKNLLGKKGPVSPPLPLHPWITARKRRVLRMMALISLVTFIIALIASIGSMIIEARSIEPWHVWGWFA